jgi:hypothetical protein
VFSVCCIDDLLLQELSRRMHKGPDGEDLLVWQLQGVTAGERIKGLAVRCVDEVGRPATAGVKGKVTVRAAAFSPPAHAVVITT